MSIYDLTADFTSRQRWGTEGVYPASTRFARFLIGRLEAFESRVENAIARIELGEGNAWLLESALTKAERVMAKLERHAA